MCISSANQTSDNHHRLLAFCRQSIALDVSLLLSNLSARKAHHGSNQQPASRGEWLLQPEAAQKVVKNAIDGAVPCVSAGRAVLPTTYYRCSF